MDPPLSLLVTVLLGSPAGVEAQVGQLGAGLVLVVAGRGGVEAGPGVEDERALGSVGHQVEARA